MRLALIDLDTLTKRCEDLIADFTAVQAAKPSAPAEDPEFLQTTPATPWLEDPAAPAEDVAEEAEASAAADLNREYEVNMAICDRFSYHPPQTEKTRDAHQVARSILHAAAHDLINGARIPAGEERDIAITKLEEAMFWANAAIARNQP